MRKIILDAQTNFGILSLMTKEQFAEAFKIARSDEDLSQVDDSILHGCGLPEFQPVTVTINCFAKLLRYQITQLNGGVDEIELNNMRWIARRKIQVV